MATVKAVCISRLKGTKKTPVPFIDIEVDHGIIGDAHAGNWHRQISLLAQESVDKMIGLGISLSPGDFAENILTSGIELKKLSLNTRLSIGETIVEVTQIGKECHSGCEIKKITGKCVMPTEGIFAKVIVKGRIFPGDTISILED